MKAFVIGAGTMGSGIAQVFAVAGWATVICDVSDELSEAGKKHIGKSLAKLVEKGKMASTEFEEILDRLSCTSDIAAASGCGIVIEAAAEKIAVKKEIFAKLGGLCNKDCILASNTSSLSVTEIASSAKYPERVIGIHFFNPAPVMKLVEVINGADTAEEITDKAIEIANAIGKQPVKVAEAPGFVGNRLLIPMINEAASILSEGIATVEDIDKAMMLGANHPMGPLALSDLIGNDVSLAIMETLLYETGDPKYRPCLLLRKMVRGGQLGRKTNNGFYKY